MTDQGPNPVSFTPDVLQRQKELEAHIRAGQEEESEWRRAEAAAEQLVGDAVPDVVRRAEVADAIKETGAIVAIFTE